MRELRSILLGLATMSGLFTAPAAATAPRVVPGDQQVSRGPILVSPGGRDREGEVGTACPTFSWAEIAGATGYELVVYEAGAGGTVRSGEQPLRRVELPAGAYAWTPELREGLAPGRYAWAVGARMGDGLPIRWSQPAVFRVTVDPPPPTRGDPQPLERVLSVGPPPLPAPVGSAHGRGGRSLTDDLYTPPACGASKFLDVSAGEACRWIEQLDRDGIMTSCDGGTNFCPDNPVTRQQLAMALGKSTRGTSTWHPVEGSNWLAPPVNNLVTAVDETGDVGKHSSITIGVDGLPILAYYDAATVRLKVAHCNDLACAPGGETVTTLNDFFFFLQYSSITIGIDGLPIISYYSEEQQALKVAHCNDIACAGQDETITLVDDPPGLNVGLYTSIAIGDDGLPIISYHDASAGTLKLAHCNDAACLTQAPPSTIDATAGHVVGKYTSIAVSPSGRPVISYYDETAQDLKVAVCYDKECTVVIDNIVDAGDIVATATSIAIGSDGLPIISYGATWIDFDGNVHPSLRVAHCNDLFCHDIAPTISVPSSFVGGLDSSLTIGADGLPVISHYDAIFGSLLVTHCSDPSCAVTFYNTNRVDGGTGGPDVGRHSAITIGADGLPIIGYYDATAGDLRVIHCSNAFCSPYFRRR